MHRPLVDHGIRNEDADFPLDDDIKVFTEIAKIDNLRLSRITFENKGLTYFPDFMVSNFTPFFEILNLLDDLI